MNIDSFNFNKNDLSFIVTNASPLITVQTSLTGLAKNISTLFISRALIGVGESSLSPNAMSMLSDVFPQERRGLATAIYYLGIPLGVGFGFLIASVLGPILGWRTIFISLGVIGIVIGVLIYFMTEPVRGSFDKKNSQSLGQQKMIPIPIILVRLNRSPKTPIKTDATE